MCGRMAIHLRHFCLHAANKLVRQLVHRLTRARLRACGCDGLCQPLALLRIQVVEEALAAEAEHLRAAVIVGVSNLVERCHEDARVRTEVHRMLARRAPALLRGEQIDDKRCVLATVHAGTDCDGLVCSWFMVGWPISESAMH